MVKREGKVECIHVGKDVYWFSAHMEACTQLFPLYHPVTAVVESHTCGPSEGTSDTPGTPREGATDVANILGPSEGTTCAPGI